MILLDQVFSPVSCDITVNVEVRGKTKEILFYVLWKIVKSTLYYYIFSSHIREIKITLTAQSPPLSTLH